MLRKKERLTSSYKDIPTTRGWEEGGRTPPLGSDQNLPFQSLPDVTTTLAWFTVSLESCGSGLWKTSPLLFTNWVTDTTQAENTRSTGSKVQKIQDWCTRGNLFRTMREDNVQEKTWTTACEIMQFKLQLWRLKEWMGLYVIICIRLWWSALNFHRALLFNSQQL